MNRRDFVGISLASATALASGRTWGTSPASVLLRLKVDAHRIGNPVPADFAGLSYESAVLSDPTFLAPDNTQLIGFFSRLGERGVLRIGGNTSEYSLWTPSGQPRPAPSQPLGPDSGGHAPPRRPITQTAIRNLRGFLDATGWSLIYGLNFGTEDPETCADEADYVTKEIGPRLVSLQLGNEADLFSHNGLRKTDYDFDQFATEWRRYRDAIRKRIPNAAFSGPDTAVNSQWLAQFARLFGGDVRFLSQHYYAEGPPSDPDATISRLLDSKNARLESLLGGMAEARANAPGVPFRLTETNSCYGGGKADVSNTFASALWGVDLMYRMATAGAAGINFHGGGYGWYSPIVGIREAGFLARPLYCGMLMFAEAGPGHLVLAVVDNPASAPLFNAYAVKNPDGKLKLALINKDAEADVAVHIEAPAPAPAIVQRLSAPRLDDTQGATFAGATVGRSGQWSPAASEPITVQLPNPLTSIDVPRASAALVTFG